MNNSQTNSNPATGDIINQTHQSHRSQRGRPNRRRGGRHREAGEPGRGPPEQTVNGAVAAQTGESDTRGHGNSHRGRRGGRSHGGFRNPRGNAPATTFGNGRAFRGHLTADVADNTGNNDPSRNELSAEAPEFVPGGSVTTKRNNAERQHRQHRRPESRRQQKSTALDLSSRIQEDISNEQYECVICTSEVLSNSRIWSCSICWTVTHITCVFKWYDNQTKKPEQPNAQPTKNWRCPGCNSSLGEEAPAPYHCWCGKELGPTPVPGLPPHSCHQTCSKPRGTCPHPCGLICHPGPCPPCTLVGPALSCFCGKNTSTKRCAKTDYSNGWSCKEPCQDFLPCGEHTCQRACHSGLCGSCETLVPVRCYCGREHKEMPCEDRGEKLVSLNHGRALDLPVPSIDLDGIDEPRFWGQFECGRVCNRPFDCGNHQCQQPCHRQDEDQAHCPLSPDVVTRCPCGKASLGDLLEKPRESCLDPVPKCQAICNKPLSCGHRCPAGCHDSSCPPCKQDMDITCQCGRTTTTTMCHQGSISPPQCLRVCRAQLNCGRHLHDVHCCSGERKALSRVTARRKRRNFGASTEDFEAEHICTRVCGRLLKCNKHQCNVLCHSGACPTCPEAIFEEISCHCGKTVLQPPQPCGTKPPDCRFQCVREQQCGHPRVTHNCHGDDTACPPCPFLVEKTCVCGKKSLKNQPCWLKEPRCGMPCNKKLKCGAHLCTKTCHGPGQCEDVDIRGSHCTQPCLKPRKFCDHFDAEPCHAPYKCKEEKPCQAKTFVTCECQHKKQEVKCLASQSNPTPTRLTLKCDDECLRLQRNARLAAALMIDPKTHSDDHVPYSDTTLRRFRENIPWAQNQEREFRVFANEPKEKRIRFKPMASHQRAFLHVLAEDYGFDSQSQDPEPHRHVSIFKTPRFVSAPAKTLAQCLKIRDADSALQQQQQQQSTQDPSAQDEPQPFFNAVLLTSPRFGLTVDELQAALAKDLATQRSLVFSIDFIPADEVVIKATGGWTEQTLEASLITMKPAVSQTIQRLGFAKGVFLCRVDSDLGVVRREVDSGYRDPSGWSAVAGRSATRKLVKKMESTGGISGGGSTAVGAPVRSKFVALKKEPKKKLDDIPVEEDWESAAEKLEELAVNK